LAQLQNMLSCSGQGGMFDHKDTLGYLSAQLARHVANRLREGLIPLGLLPAQYTALAEIARAEGLTQKDLVERLDVEQPGVARTLAGLEAMGWIERRQVKGRAQSLHLTERARAALPRANEVAADIERQVFASLSRTERSHLLDTLVDVAASLRAAEGRNS
jgi:DNA-binding MarR family transcriptional regulator